MVTQRDRARTVFFIGGGLALGCFLGWAAWTMAGAGHGTYLPAILLFPYTMLIAAVIGRIAAPLMVLALLQFAVYGALLSVASDRKTPRMRLAQLALWHGIAMLAAFAVAAMTKGFLK